METETALVRSDGGVELDAEPAVDLDVAVVVDPRNAEDNLSLWLHDALEDSCFNKVRTGVSDRVQSGENFGDSLDELRLVSVSLGNGLEYFVEMLIVHVLSSYLRYK